MTDKIEPALQSPDKAVRPLDQVRKLPDMEYVPASLISPLYSGLGIYIKWQGHGRPYGTEVVSASSWNTHLRLPDREVLMVGDLNRADGMVSLSDWDEFVPLSIFHDGQYFDSLPGPQTFMVNAFYNSAMGKQLSRVHNTRRHRTGLNKRTIVGDSGAYQLRNINKFIDPVSVARFYNDNVDYGVVLDFSMLDPTVWENLRDGALIQKANTELMKTELNSAVQLINVAHGVRNSHRLAHLEIVHDPDIRSVALTKNYFTDGITAFVSGLKGFVDELQVRWPGHYTHLHLLGITETKLYLPIMRMAALGQLGDLKITMDSSTHLRTASSRRYLHHAHGLQTLKALAIGDDENLANPNMKLPCNCAVCASLGWTDALNILTNTAGLTFFLMYHNIYATDHYFKQMLWYATHLDDYEIDELCKRLFKTNRHIRNEIMETMRFIRTIDKKGYAKAVKRYRLFLEVGNTSERENEASDVKRINAALPSLFGHVLHDQYASDEDLGVERIDKTTGHYKPLHVVDRERLTLYKQRLEGLRRKIALEADQQFTGRVTTQQRVTGGKDAPKRRHKKVELENHAKGVSNVKAMRTGASLKHHKAKRVKDPTKPKVKKSLGRVVKKSDQKRRQRI